MELVRKTIHMMRQKGRAVSQMTLDDDYNIPEAMPDAGMIVQEKGKLEIGDIRTENGRVIVRGSLQFFILYMEDAEESGLYSVKGQIPFEENMNVEAVQEGDSLKLDWMLEDVSAVLINSRKFGIKAVVTLELAVEELKDQEVPVAAEGIGGLQVKTCPLSAAALAVRKRDTCRVKDEIILPANKPNIRKVIWQDVALQGTELRLGDGEISVKGELVVFLLYESEEDFGKAGWLEQILPFNSRVDAAGCGEGMLGSLKLALANADLEIKPDYDGELRVINIDALLELDIRVYQEEKLDMICDLYHPALDLVPEVSPAVCESLLLSNASKCRVSDRLKTGAQEPSILQLCHGSGEIRIDSCSAAEDGILVEGAVQVRILYVTADDSHPMLCLKGDIPFEHRVEVPGIKKDSVWYIHTSLEQLGVDMVSSAEVEVKAVVLVNALVFASQTIDCITGVSENPPDPEALRALPGFLLYVAQPADTLWDVAKAYRTRTDRIRELNGLASEELRSGQKLILVKEMEREKERTGTM